MFRDNNLYYLECNAENFTCAGDLTRFRKKGPNLRLWVLGE